MREEEEEWEVVLRDVNDDVEVCEMNVRRGFRQHSSIVKSEAAVLIEHFLFF